MKLFFILLVVSSSVYAAPEGNPPASFSGTPMEYKREKFAECASPSCIYVLCEQVEMVEFDGFLPGLGCMKAMRKNSEGKHVFDFYEIGVRELASEAVETMGHKKKNFKLMFRVR